MVEGEGYVHRTHECVCPRDIGEQKGSLWVHNPYVTIVYLTLPMRHSNIIVVNFSNKKKYGEIIFFCVLEP